MVCRDNFLKATLPVNFGKISSRFYKPFLVIAFLAATSCAWAQSPTYRPPPPPTKGTAFELRLRYLMAPDIGFSGFGSIPLRSIYESNENLFLGTQRYIDYDDGFLAQDLERASLIAGENPDQERVPSGNRDATSFFSYGDEAQVNPDDPTYLTFHRYASVGNPDVILEGSGSGSMGWELNYTKVINRKRNLGFLVGFSFNGFDSRFNDSIAADLYVQEFRHDMYNGVEVPDLPDPIENEDGSITQDPYIGDQVHPEGGTTDLLEWLASEESEELLADGATVDAQADLRSSVYNFRAGPTYNLALGNAFGFNLGAGVSAIYFNGRFSAYEILLGTGSEIDPSRSLTTTEESEWQLGGYVDASAYYNMTERVSVFSGLQLQSGSTYSQQNEERQASVDFSSQVYVHAGLGIKF